MKFTAQRLLLIRRACAELLALHARVAALEEALAAEVDRARAQYGFTPFAGETGNDDRQDAMAAMGTRTD